jgi:antitoxin ParD1/3/4
MNVSLTPELESFVQAKVQSGRYTSASEVIREALRLLETHESAQARQLHDLRVKVDQGLASLGRGEGADGESFMKSLLHAVDRPRNKRKTG